MKANLLRGVAVTTLAAAVLLSAGAQPARAWDGPKKAEKIITVGFSLFRIDNRLSEAMLKELVTVVLAQLTDARNEVLVHLDERDAAAATKAAIDASREFSDFEVLRQNEIGLEMWALRVASHASSAKVDLERIVTTNRNAADQIGLAANTTFPIAMELLEYAGLSGSYAHIRANFIELNETILRELEPRCVMRPGELDPHPSIEEVTYTCTAANGDQAVARDYRVGGRWIEGPVDLQALKVEAATNSSWVVAMEFLPILRAP